MENREEINVTHNMTYRYFSYWALMENEVLKRFATNVLYCCMARRISSFSCAESFCSVSAILARRAVTSVNNGTMLLEYL